MTFIIRRSNLTIKTYLERVDDVILEAGETIEESPLSFISYSKRLLISCNGKSGESVFVPAGTSCLQVDVYCPGEQSVDLDVDGMTVPIPLTDGKGFMLFSCQEPGAIYIQPKDQVKYCPGGQSSLTIEVTE